MEQGRSNSAQFGVYASGKNPKPSTRRAEVSDGIAKIVIVTDPSKTITS